MRSTLLLAASLVLAACGESGHGHDHGHAHDDEHSDEHSHDDEHGQSDEHAGSHEDEHGHAGGDAISVTRWSDALELFAEHAPVIAGEETSFLAHLTVLEGFRPLENARVRLALTGPGEVTTDADMLRPGIYRLDFTVPSAGTYHGRVSILEGGEGAVDGFEIEVFESHEAAAGARGAEEASPATVSFLKEQQWRVPFATAFATTGEVRPTAQVTGELTTPPHGMAHVHAPVPGRVMAGAGGAFPSPGDQVTAGQVLVSIAPTPGAPEDAARAGLAVVEAQARVEGARAESERVERMLTDRAIPQRRASEAQRALRVAEESLSAARRVQALYSAASTGRGRGSWRITSPIDGVIDDVHVSPGEAVQPEEQLFHIIDASLLWVRADVPESWAARLRTDADAAFLVVGDDRFRPIRLSGDAPNATVAHVARSVDPVSRTVRVVYALSDPDESLRVGAAIRVSIPVGDPLRGVVLPRSAVDDVQGRTVVYVQTEGEAFEERVVRIGAQLGERVALTDGLDAGERVVTVGAHLVHLASAGGETVGHGHVH